MIPPCHYSPVSQGYAKPCLVIAILILAVFAALPRQALGQGCVALKAPAGSPVLETMQFHTPTTLGSSPEPAEVGKGSKKVMVPMSPPPREDKWTLSFSYRWFTSDRHFSEDVEQVQRQELDNQVENDVHYLDTSLTYAFNKRLLATLSVPYIWAERSSLYEHDLVHRFSMRADGIGDLRAVVDWLVFDPNRYQHGNIAVGLGLKFPTGDDDARATAHRATGDVRRPVDPSIQPGDGGWGIIAEVNAFQYIYKGLSAYLSASYLSTPEEQSGTELTVADVPAFQAFITDEIRHNTIADQYFARAGLSYDIAYGVSLSFGARIEGVPAHDIIGGDFGFRRPGYTVSLEPGISWTGEKVSVAVSVPIAVYRNRIRSAPEEALGRPAGDAAFADYFVQASVAYRF